MKALLALTLAPVLASATPVQTGPGTRWDSDMPPVRFQGEAVLPVAFVNSVAPYCGTAPAGLVVIACTKQVDGNPVIIMPNPCIVGDLDDYAKILCHEKAHALGWPANHPQ